MQKFSFEPRLMGNSYSIPGLALLEKAKLGHNSCRNHARALQGRTLIIRQGCTNGPRHTRNGHLPM
jgi:hypothetical protein